MIPAPIGKLGAYLENIVFLSEPHGPSATPSSPEGNHGYPPNGASGDVQGAYLPVLFFLSHTSVFRVSGDSNFDNPLVMAGIHGAPARFLPAILTENDFNQGALPLAVASTSGNTVHKAAVNLSALSAMLALDPPMTASSNVTDEFDDLQLLLRLSLSSLQDYLWDQSAPASTADASVAGVWLDTSATRD